jgi:tetratricopeptide (TPR) repeat protein
MLGLAQVAWHHGRADEAVSQGIRALDEARADESPLGQAHALWFLGDVARLTGDLSQSEARFREALALFEAQDDLRGVARCLYGLAFVARSTNDLDEAQRLYQRAFDTLEPLGVRRGLAHCLNGLGEVARFRNRLSEAREYYRRAVDLYQSAGLATDAAVSLTNLGLVGRDAGDLQGARDAMERALRVAEATDYQYLTLGIAFNLAWVYALMGERKLCEKMLDENLHSALKSGLVDPDFARPLEGIAGLLDAAGESKAARQLYEWAKDMWEEMRRDRDASRVGALLR